MACHLNPGGYEAASTLVIFLIAPHRRLFAKQEMIMPPTMYVLPRRPVGIRLVLLSTPMRTHPTFQRMPLAGGAFSGSCFVSIANDFDCSRSRERWSKTHSRPVVFMVLRQDTR